MELRKAENADLPAIGGLYRAARAAMKAAGIDQWQEGDYPNEADAKKDMDQGRCYVLTQGGQVIAVACLAFGHEPTYDVIEGGSWGSSAEYYGFLHRIAVAPQAKGQRGCSSPSWSARPGSGAWRPSGATPTGTTSPCSG